MARPRVSSPEDPLVNLWVTIPKSMKQQLEAQKVNVSVLVRGFFAEYLNSDSGEEEELRRKLEEIEPKYLSLKTQLEENRKRRQTAETEEQEKWEWRKIAVSKYAQQIQDSPGSAYRLREILEQFPREWRITIEEFKQWFERNYPGLIEKVYRKQEGRKRGQ